MRSAAKIVIAVLIGVIGLGLSGIGAGVAFGKDITLVVDGVSQPVAIVYGSVADVLADQNIQLGERDKVVPALDETVSADTVVTVSHARPLELTLNSQDGVYWTYATTVEQVLAELGLDESALQLSATLDTLIPVTGMDLTVETAAAASVTVAGQTQAVNAFGTVGDALTALGLSYDADDLVSPAPSQPLAAGTQVTLVKVDTKMITRDIDIPFTTQNSNDPDSLKGTVTVVTKGVKGTAEETVQQTLQDGVVVSETVVSTTTVTAPVTEVTKTGTKAIDVDPESAQGIAYQMIHDRGWDDSQFQCLVTLWNHESHWNVSAANRSGAYGIPQALPGSKMASAGADWKTNPATQITWGLGYITGRYGTPCSALAHWQGRGWY